MLVHHELNADLRRAFLAGLGQENHVAVERHISPFQFQHCHEGSDDVIFVINGAPAIHIAAVSRCAKRRERPLPGIDIHDVGVAHNKERPLLAAALQPRNDIRPIRLESKHLGRYAFLLEHLAKVFGGGPLISWRVARIETQQRLVMLHRLVFKCLPINLLRILRENGGGSQHSEHNA